MNPYAIIGALVFYMASIGGTWFYAQHEANAACASKVEAVQLTSVNKDLAASTTNEKAATETAANTDTTTSEHSNAEDKIDAKVEPAKAKVQVIHDLAPATDCLRQPVDARTDVELRNATGSSSGGTPAGSVPGRNASSSSG